MHTTTGPMSDKTRHSGCGANSKRRAVKLLENGNTGAAEQLLRKICAKNCNDPEVWYYLALIEANSRRVEQAIISLQTCLKYSPSSIQVMNGLAGLYSSQGHADKAEKLYRNIIKLNPESPEAHYNLGVVLQGQLRLEEASKYYEKALRIKPDWVEANNNLGYVYYTLGELDKAYGLFINALECRPNYDASIAGAAGILEKKKRHQEAYDLINPLLVAGEVSCGIILVYASICRFVNRCEDVIQRLERMVNNHRFPPDERSKMYFALTKLYDSKGLYDKAFDNAAIANKLKNFSFDRHRFSSMIDSMISVFGVNYTQEMPHSGSQSERPVFIVGMPRSGTSLVEQIICAHPDVYGAGELGDIPQIATVLPALAGNKLEYPECIRMLNHGHLKEFSGQYVKELARLDPNSKRVTDKLPLNFLNLGLISLLFPHARVIHCTRNPMDTCISCYLNDFTGLLEFAYDLGDLGFFYREYSRLMDHWHEVLSIPITDICYESLIREPETAMRRLIDACGLEWNPLCLRYHLNDRYVHTISHEDVNRPLYNSSIGSWCNYEKYLKPLRVALQYQKPMAIK